VPVDDFEDRVEHFALSSRPIVLGDMQGRSQYAHNQLLAGIADYGILITRNPVPKDEAVKFPQLVPEWLELFAELKLEPSIWVHTLVEDQEPLIELPDHAIVIRDMDRSLVPFHPQIQKVALRILDLASNV